MNRLKEPSTWAGLASLFQVIGVIFPQYAAYALALTAGASAVAVKLPEASK